MESRVPRRKRSAGGVEICRSGLFGLPDTSEFHLYAESMRMGGLAGNSEELAPNSEGRYSKKRFGTTAQGSQGRRGIKKTDTKTYKKEDDKYDNFRG
jgi:hypothetical protein